MTQYAYNLDIPDEVMEHGSVALLEDITEDLIAWANVRSFSFVIYQFVGRS